MLDGIIGQPTQNNTDYNSAQPVLDDDVFASILGYMAPIPVAPAPEVLTPEKEEVLAHSFDAEPVVAAEPTERVSYADAQIEEIEVTKIVPNPFQPRKIFDPEGLKELSKSIREHGVIQPLVVTKTAAGYELVVGERRFRASILAGLAKVPAIVKQTLEDQTKLEVALIENIQRRELNAIEEALLFCSVCASWSTAFCNSPSGTHLVINPNVSAS